MSTCTCQPGTAENFWTEQRCPACLDEERRIWAECMARWMESS